jgi:hypothetical protein
MVTQNTTKTAPACQKSVEELTRKLTISELRALAKFSAESMVGRRHSPRLSAPNKGLRVWERREKLNQAGQIYVQQWYNCCRAWVNPVSLRASYAELDTISKWRKALAKFAKNNAPREVKKNRCEHENKQRKIRHEIREKGREILRNGVNGPLAVFRAGWKNFPTVIPAVSTDEVEILEMSTKRCCNLMESLEFLGGKYNATVEVAVPHPHRDRDWRRQVLHYWVPCKVRAAVVKAKGGK